MEQAEWAKAIGIFLLSAVKLLFAPGAAVASGFTPLQAVALTSSGGCSGVIFFYYFGHWAMKKVLGIHQRYFVKDLPGKPPLRKRKVFSNRNRMIVRVKYNFGMLGLAVLTPAVLSIPIGAVISARFYFDNKFMLPLLLVSTTAWCVGLTYFSSTVKQYLFDW